MTKNPYLSDIQLKCELDKCLNCKNKPCMFACPVNCNPQQFIAQAKDGNFSEAVKTICQNNPMAETCGLICPSNFCMQACARAKIDNAVNIPKLQATIVHKYRNSSEMVQHKLNGKKIAVIGAGPAGIAATSVLSALGYEVTVFEGSARVGGALNLIPQKRLNSEIINRDWAVIAALPNVKIEFETKIADEQALLSDFDGIIAAVGEQSQNKLNIEGGELLTSYVNYLFEPQKYKTTGKVLVIGGGRVAADCALLAKDIGANEVEMLVRRRLPDMKISKEEFCELLDNGINISTLARVTKAEKNRGAMTLHICKTQMLNGASVDVPNSEYVIENVSCVILAIGNKSDKKDDGSRIIYAGDCKHGGSTIVEAIASGREAAQKLHRIILG